MNNITTNLSGIPFSQDEILEGSLSKMKCSDRKEELFLTLSIVLENNSLEQLLEEIKGIQYDILKELHIDETALYTKPREDNYYWYRKEDKGKEKLRFHCSLVNLKTFPGKKPDSVDEIKNFLRNDVRYRNLEEFLKTKITKFNCEYGFLYAGEKSIALQLFLNNQMAHLCHMIKFFAQSIGFYDVNSNNPRIKLYPKGTSMPNRGAINLLKIFSKDYITEEQYVKLKKLILKRNIDFFEKGLEDVEITKLEVVVSDPWLDNDNYHFDTIELK